MTAVAKETGTRQRGAGTPRSRAAERGLAGGVGGSHRTAVSQAGGGRCGACWETRLLPRCAGWDA